MLTSLALAAVLASTPTPQHGQVAAADPAPSRISLQALRQAYGDPVGHIARIGGVEVYYKDEGAGPVLLMVHGSVSTLRTWDGVVAALRTRYRIIRYDLPAQGLSGSVSDAQASKLQPTDIAEGLLAQLGVKRATVVGVSSGGTLGVDLAAKRPDLVERLVLSNAPADPVVTDHLKPSAEFQAAQAEAARTGVQSLRFWNAFLDFYSGDPTRISPALRTQYYDMNRRGPEKNATALVAKVADHAKAVAAMAAVRAPTLLIWGARDPLLPPKAAEVLASYLSGTQVSKILLPDVGHYPPLEVPARFAQILAAYIEAATPATFGDVR